MSITLSSSFSCWALLRSQVDPKKMGIKWIESGMLCIISDSIPNSNAISQHWADLLSICIYNKYCLLMFHEFILIMVLPFSGIIVHIGLSTSNLPRTRNSTIWRHPTNRQPGKIVLVEVYKNEEAPGKYKETRHYEWRETVEDMMAGPRSAIKFKNVYPRMRGDWDYWDHGVDLE